MAAHRMPGQNKEHNEAVRKLLSNRTPAEKEALGITTRFLIEAETGDTDWLDCTDRRDAN